MWTPHAYSRGITSQSPTDQPRDEPAGTGRTAYDPALNATLEEYKAMRGEVLATLQTQQQTLGFGGATLGVLVAAAAQLWADEEILSGVLLAVLVPFIACMVVVMWLAEQIRLLRVSLFLMRIEDVVCQKTQDEALWWEHWSLAEDRRGAIDVEADQRTAVLAIFSVLGVGAAVAGAVRLSATLPASVQLAIAAAAACVAVLGGVLSVGGALETVESLRADKRREAGASQPALGLTRRFAQVVVRVHAALTGSPRPEPVDPVERPRGRS